MDQDQAPRRLRILVGYDGARYHGWQRQRELPSVQGEIEAAVERVTGESVVVHGSGRTDAGVHALGQVAHFDTASRVPARDFARALSANLPADIVVHAAAEVDATFHARFSARRKTYVYQIYVAPARDPLREPYALRVSRAPDVDAMRAAARVLVGRHDFRSFMTEAHLRDDTVRHLFALRVRARRGQVRVFASAEGFLQHMVRILTGMLLRVGDRQESAAGVERILAARDRRAAPATLPAKGLFLWRVDY